MTALDTGLSASASPQDLSALAKQLYYQSDDARVAAHVVAGRKAALAQRPLLWIAVVHTLGTMVLIAFSHGRTMDEEVILRHGAALSAVVSAAYWGIWAWSYIAPLPAAIVGLLLLTSLSWANIATSNRSGGVLPLLTMALLARAIHSGWRQRVLALGGSLDPTLLKPATRSIVSPIVLYLVLVSIVITPLSLAARHDLTIKDLLDVHKLMAIVVTCWVILSWREILPAIRHIGSINWMVTAFVFGLGTFAFASIYGDLLSYFAGIPQAKLSAPFLKEGYTWLMVLGITAVFPAIFEELAFRGVIVPGLARVLSEKETIAVSAIMFMILHLSVPSAPHLLLLGVLIGFVRLRSKSIWPCVLMHFTHNTMCMVFERWM